MAQEFAQKLDRPPTPNLIVSVALAFFIVISLSFILKSIENYYLNIPSAPVITQQKAEPRLENQTPAQSQYKYFRPKEYLA